LRIKHCVRKEVNRTLVTSKQSVAGFARHNYLSRYYYLK
jgi:hypothetical protein